MSIADSPCPMNGLAAATTASAPEHRMLQKKNTAALPMNHCTIPQWNKTETRATKNMIAGKTEKKN